MLPFHHHLLCHDTSIIKGYIIINILVWFINNDIFLFYVIRMTFDADCQNKTKGPSKGARGKLRFNATGDSTDLIYGPYKPWLFWKKNHMYKMT